MERVDGLAAELLRTSDKYRMLERGDAVLVALSGGADSVALTALLSELAAGIGIHVFAAHLNHGLRGESSDADERFVREFCGSRGIPLETAREDIAGAAGSSGMGIEETARRIRYRFLQNAAERFGCSKIATAHTANDNAETLLLHLARGTGLRGLCGIPPVRGNIIRPLIRSSREEVEQYLAFKEIAYVTDQTNFDTAYTRNKIRHEVIPRLLEINPAFIENAAEASDLLRSDADCLDCLAEQEAKAGSDGACMDRERLLQLPDALAGRVVRRLYTEAAGSLADCPPSAPELAKAHVDAVMELAAKSGIVGEVHLPHGIAAISRYGKVEMIRRQPLPVQEETPLLSGETRFGRWRIRAEITEGAFEDKEKNAVFLEPALIGEGLTVRSNRTGDELSPADRKWTKSLKKLYIEMKIPREERGKRPVVAYRGAACAIPGFCADRRFSVRSAPALKITFHEDSGRQA